MENVLITGGTGLVGSDLVPFLKEKGYETFILSRKASKRSNTLYWNPARKHIDFSALQKMDYIVHLAGANVFDKPWNDQYKKEIIESRVEGIRLLAMAMKEHGVKPKAFISASAIGIYGADTGDKWCDETTPAGSGFLTEVVQAWEKEADSIAEQGIRTVKFRIGLVLSKEGGVLAKLRTPTLFGMGSALGSGKQYMPWIDVRDLSGMIEHAMKNPLQGVYNAAAPNPVTNNDFGKMLAKHCKRPYFMPAVPEFALKLLFGAEKSSILVGGNKVSPNKIIQTGFQFSYPDLPSSLAHLLG